MDQLFSLLSYVVDVFLHLDVHIASIVASMGPWVYLFLFLILFCETGLVVTPFLPGDSLLFAIGAVSALPDSTLNIYVMTLTLFVAAVSGDAVNYFIGGKVGPKVFTRESSLLFNKKHLNYAQRFYEKHGGKTIILARFVPIARTFAPFVAGIGRMKYRKFAFYNFIGAALWVVPFVTAGYLVGNMPAVKDNFHILIVAIIFISVMPGVIEWVRVQRAQRVSSLQRE
ncbi:MAG: DedA family protein [Oligoflexales bacterium]